jgi:hypothetical protein
MHLLLLMICEGERGLSSRLFRPLRLRMSFDASHKQLCTPLLRSLWRRQRRLSTLFTGTCAYACLANTSMLTTVDFRNPRPPAAALVQSRCALPNLFASPHHRGIRSPRPDTLLLVARCSRYSQVQSPRTHHRQRLLHKQSAGAQQSVEQPEPT